MKKQKKSLEEIVKYSVKKYGKTYKALEKFDKLTPEEKEKELKRIAKHASKRVVSAFKV